MKAIAVSGLVVVFASSAIAQSGQTCPDIEKETNAVTASYQPKLDQIGAEGEELGKQKPEGPEVAVGVDFDIKWNDKKFSMDIPEVSMKNRDLIFDVPQVTMKDRKIVFHTPSVKMENQKVGQYPEFKCEGLKCSTKWSDIITKVPVTILERQEIVTKVPEFKMDRTKIVTKIPEFKMDRKDMILRIPEFVAKNVKAETRKMNEKAQALSVRGEQVSSEMKAELISVTRKGFQCQRDNISTEIFNLSEATKKNVNQIQAVIEYFTKIGVDPSKVTSDTGEVVNYPVMLQQIVDASKKAIEEMQKAMKEISDREREVMEQLTRT